MVISSNFNMNENWFSLQRLRTYTRFEIEAELNSEMAYFDLILLEFSILPKLLI